MAMRRIGSRAFCLQITCFVHLQQRSKNRAHDTDLLNKPFKPHPSEICCFEAALSEEMICTYEFSQACFCQYLSFCALGNKVINTIVFGLCLLLQVLSVHSLPIKLSPIIFLVNNIWRIFPFVSLLAGEGRISPFCINFAHLLGWSIMPFKCPM